MVIREPELIWNPLPGSQVTFMKSDVFETLYEGTRGPGKTDALIMDFLQHVGVGWGAEWRGILFRQTYPQLKDVEAKCNKWIKQAFPGARYNKSEHVWSFPDGEELLLRHMKDSEDYWNYHGHAYPWIGWEELTGWATSACYTRMMSCCRSTVPLDARDSEGSPMPRKYRSTTNPYGVGHNWVKKRFRLPEYRGIVIDDAMDEDGNVEPERVAVHGRIEENTILLEAEPDYIQRIAAAARNPNERRAWLFGDWTITAGGMFDDLYSPKHHTLDPFDIPKTWRITRSFDWGSSRPFSVGWWATSDGSDVKMVDGKVKSTVRGDRFRIAEWYGCGPGENVGLVMPASKIAEGVVKREISLGLRDSRGKPTRIWAGAADSSIWDESQGPSIADQMAKKVRIDGKLMSGVGFEKADKRPGSRKLGWEKMRQMLSDALPPDEGGPREHPGLFVFRNCKKWLELVPVVPRDLEGDPDDVDTDAEDHNADETRYEMMLPNRVSRSSRTVGDH